MSNLVRNAVKLADKLTNSLKLQARVTQHSFLSQTQTGTKTYNTPIVRRALVERRQQMVRTIGGQMVQAQAKITFLQQTLVKLTDKLVMPDGTTGPILNTEGFIDADSTTGAAYLTEVWLG